MKDHSFYATQEQVRNHFSPGINNRASRSAQRVNGPIHKSRHWRLRRRSGASHAGAEIVYFEADKSEFWFVDQRHSENVGTLCSEDWLDHRGRSNALGSRAHDAWSEQALFRVFERYLCSIWTYPSSHRVREWQWLWNGTLWSNKIRTNKRWTMLRDAREKTKNHPKKKQCQSIDKAYTNDVIWTCPVETLSLSRAMRTIASFYSVIPAISSSSLLLIRLRLSSWTDEWQGLMCEWRWLLGSILGVWQP